MQIDEHTLSLSYGKDSLACLGAIESLKLPPRTGGTCGSMGNPQHTR